MDISKLFNVLGDAVGDIPDIQKSVPLIQQMIDAAKAGKPANLTKDQLEEVQADFNDLTKLIHDVSDAIA